MAGDTQGPLFAALLVTSNKVLIAVSCELILQ